MYSYLYVRPEHAEQVLSIATGKCWAPEPTSQEVTHLCALIWCGLELDGIEDHLAMLEIPYIFVLEDGSQSWDDGRAQAWAWAPNTEESCLDVEVGSMGIPRPLLPIQLDGSTTEGELYHLKNYLKVAAIIGGREEPQCQTALPLKD